MRKLSEAGRQRAQATIDRNPQRYHAEPGFPVMKEKLLREPAIILYVSWKRTEFGE